MRRDRRAKALALMVVLTIAVVFVHLDPFGAMRPLEGSKVVGCDGQAVWVDGRESELLRLHNEARAVQGLQALCVTEELMSAARGHSEDMITRDF